MSFEKTLDLAKELIQCRSIAPDDDGAQGILKRHLAPLGFELHDVPCQGRENLWAEIGTEGPLLAIAVHTDVVPEGDDGQWTSPAFEPQVRNGHLYGRGAVDMKSEIACVLSAISEAKASENGSFPNGYRLGLFVTGDEEPEGNYGANAILDYLEGQGKKIDYALITEPSSESSLGDTLKIGRRGSIHGRLRVLGEQKHSSYQDQSVNPIYLAMPALKELADTYWDSGNDHFPPTVFQFTSVQASGGASNTTPSELLTEFNLRFSNELTAEQIKEKVNELLEKHKITHHLEWSCNAHPFLTQPGPYVHFLGEAIEKVTKIQPKNSTGGGTSDGRFIAARGAQVLEFGLLGGQCHMVDECASLVDIENLEKVYFEFLRGFSSFAQSSAQAI